MVAPCVLNAVSLFDGAEALRPTMIDLGVVEGRRGEKLHPKKEIAGVLSLAAGGGSLWLRCGGRPPISYLSGGLPLIVGF